MHEEKGNMFKMYPQGNPYRVLPGPGDPRGIVRARAGLGRPLPPDLSDLADEGADQETLTSSRAAICPRFRPRASRSSLLGRPPGLRTLVLSSWTLSPSTATH